MDKDQGCPMQGCDGSGHISGNFSTHRSLSGCPLSIRFSELQQQSETKTCPTPGCDGSGNTKSMYTFHRSIQRCPLIRQKLEQSNLSIEQMEEMLNGKSMDSLESSSLSMIQGTSTNGTISITSSLANNNNKTNNNQAPRKHSTKRKNNKHITTFSNKSFIQKFRKEEINKECKINPTSVSKNKIKNYKIMEKKLENQNGNLNNKEDSIIYNEPLRSLGFLKCESPKDFVEESKEYTRLYFQRLEQSFGKLQQEESRLFEKISSAQKDIEKIKNEKIKLESRFRMVSDAIINVCKEIDPTVNGELENYLSLLEDIVQNRNKEEYHSLFTIVKDNLLSTNLSL